MNSAKKRSGLVVIVGRPNVGKSTLLNNLLGTKVSVTSPHPQTTRFNIQAILNDERGQIIFVDTPGIFAKVQDETSRRINQRAKHFLGDEVDLILYVVDVTRSRGLEENRLLGILRKIEKPKLLVFNKIDVTNRDFRADYEFLKAEMPQFIEVSALEGTHLKGLLNLIFENLPEKEQLLPPEITATPLLNVDSKKFIEEIIREKVFLNSRDEVPYSVGVEVHEITERANGLLYVRATIFTSHDRYKGMLIGREGRRIKEIGQAVRKELEVARGQKVFADLTIAVDERWLERLL